MSDMGFFLFLLFRCPGSSHVKIVNWPFIRVYIMQYTSVQSLAELKHSRLINKLCVSVSSTHQSISGFCLKIDR